MKPDLLSVLEQCSTKGWKKVSVEFTGGPLVISVPRHCVVITMKKVEVLKDPAGEIRRAIDQPCAGPRLEEIVCGKGKPVEELKVALTVSDITRPVPYRGKIGILRPLLKKLAVMGIPRQNLRIIVGTGTHRASTPQEKEEMFGPEVLRSYIVQDHDGLDESGLVSVGRTPAGTEVYLNRTFYEADLKIITGLTESHFMVGASGGRKAVCPGLVGQRTIQKFHGPDFLESPLATNLVLEGNPCHEEATAVARLAGVDFAVTATLDKDMRLTGVFAGSMETVLEKAVNHIKTYVEIPIDEEFDIVLTHGGYVGRSHYQTAKAAVGALPAVKPNGVMIIAADNHDREPVGGPVYRTLSHLLKLQGVDGYMDLLRSSSWKFTKEQWEPEVWGRVLRKVGEAGLIYCAPDIPEKDFAMLPGISGTEFLTPAGKKKSRVQKTQEMVQNALIYYLQTGEKKSSPLRLAFIREGPYAVPVLAKPAKTP
jgi:lactate racemase